MDEKPYTENWLTRLSMPLMHAMLPCHDKAALFPTVLSLIVAIHTHLATSIRIPRHIPCSFSSMTISAHFNYKRNAEAERIMS